MHLVFRLSDEPIRIFNNLGDFEGETFRRAVVGGIRSGFYVKDTAPASCTVGAMLEVGAAQILFGAGADELSERHTALEDLWGNRAVLLWEALREASDLEEKLQRFEGFLLKLVPRVHGIHPAIAHALERFGETTQIGRIVKETGYSHRRFIELFHRTVGLPPRVYTRLLRFRKALKIVSAQSTPCWIDIAMEGGYSDQAHFNREFRRFTGLTPSEYVTERQSDIHHIPLGGQIRSIRRGAASRIVTPYE